jgi:hypothetical protein
MGDRLRLWEDQCEPVALKRAEAREKVSIHAREESGSKGIMEINYIDEMWGKRKPPTSYGSAAGNHKRM